MHNTNPHTHTHSLTSFGCGKGGNVTSVGWQVILCDPICHVSSRSGEASCELLYSVYLFLEVQETLLILHCIRCIPGTRVFAHSV